MEISQKGKPFHSILYELDAQFPVLTIDRSIPLRGTPRLDVESELDHRLRIDTPYQSGKVLGAMTTEPHEFARLIYSKYMNRNLGDRGLNPGTARIEKEVIQMLGSLLGNPHVTGNITSGGTEANLIAMYLAKQSKPSVIHPSIVIPDSAHYSFNKAATLMGLQIRRARLLPDFTLDLDHYESLIDETTIALVGIIGTSALGLIDPIEDIASLARKYQIYFHVDAAFGGLVIPFMEQLGYEFPRYSLDIPEICSFTVDPHKMGGAVNPTGCLLINDQSLDRFGFQIPYLAGGGHQTYNILGTRPGASAISFWALMKYLGKEGMQATILQAWENTVYLQKRIEEMPQLRVVVEPTMNVLGITTTARSSLTIPQLNESLRQRGWALGYFEQWDLLRVVMMPHVHKSHLEHFLADLHEIYAHEL
jgi:tyrosine decarboxylase/aspartate 1-decarboxylase